MLKIKNLKASVEDKQILKGVNLEIGAGEIHAIMGPNGSGKSTLASVLTGKEGYTVDEGEVTFNGKDLLDLDPEDRAGEGLFLAFQYPVEIPGVSMVNFLRTSVNAVREYRGQSKLSGGEFLKVMKEKKELVELDTNLTKRAVNEGFSGGEKKRNEIFQMALLEPTMVIMDETDSGLDIDALRTVSEAVNKLRRKDNSFLIITHYQRLLNYIEPDFVHVFYDGQIVRSGDKNLALELEEKGYDWLRTTSSAHS